MTIQTFIFVHNQDIIIDFINHKKFNNLSNLKYIFLGNREIDKIISLDNVIIARNLGGNIEDYPNLTSFSGWYVLWKHKLVNSDYVNLFEYDVNIHNDFESIVENTLKESKIGIIGYIPFNVHNVAFLKMKQWSEILINEIKLKYNLDVLDFISKLPKDKQCSMTSNHTFSKESFEQYMNWINPMVDNIKQSYLSGHQMERSICVFYLTNNITNTIIPNVLHHFQFDSHKTQGIGEQKFIQNYNNLLK